MTLALWPLASGAKNESPGSEMTTIVFNSFFFFSFFCNSDEGIFSLESVSLMILHLLTVFWILKRQGPIMHACNRCGMGGLFFFFFFSHLSFLLSILSSLSLFHLSGS